MNWNADLEYEVFHKIRSLYTMPPQGQAMIIEVLGINDFRIFETSIEEDHRRIADDFNRRKIAFGVLYNIDGSEWYSLAGNFIHVFGEGNKGIEHFEEMGSGPPVDRKALKEEWDLLLKMLNEKK